MRFTDEVGSEVFFCKKVFIYYFFFLSPVFVRYILNLPPVKDLEGFIVLPQLLGLLPCDEATGLRTGGGEL